MQKLDHPAPAASMYTSPLFRKSMDYARRLKPRRIFILSARYGVLEPTDVIDPYDRALSTMSASERRRWAAGVLQSLRARADLAHDEFVILAGQSYREHVVPALANARVPMAGLSIGRQLRHLGRR